MKLVVALCLLLVGCERHEPVTAAHDVAAEDACTKDGNLMLYVDGTPFCVQVVKQSTWNLQVVPTGGCTDDIHFDCMHTPGWSGYGLCGPTLPGKVCLCGYDSAQPNGWGCAIVNDHQYH